MHSDTFIWHLLVIYDNALHKSSYAHFIVQSFIDFMQIFLASKFRFILICVCVYSRYLLSIFFIVWHQFYIVLLAFDGSHTSWTYLVTLDYRISVWSLRSFRLCAYATAWKFIIPQLINVAATRLPFLICVRTEPSPFFLAINLFYGPAKNFQPKQK